MEDALTQMTNELEARVEQVTEVSLIGMKEYLNIDYNIAFVRGALWRAARKLLTLMVKDDGVREVFEAAIN